MIDYQLYLQNLIVEGLSAKVYEGTINHQPSAIKIYYPHTKLQEIQKEIDSLKLVNHLNIIKYVSYDQSQKPGWLGMELCQRFDLFELLKSSGKFDTLYARYFVQKLANALQYLHGQGLVHRDIKPENIFFGLDYEPKLGDLGFLTSSIQEALAVRHQGTIGYLAPELFAKTPFIKPQELPDTDMFSFGVLIFIIVSGFPPIEYSSLQQNTSLKIIYKKRWDLFWKKQPGVFEDSFKEMIEGLLSFNPEERWKIDQLQQCKWMNLEKCSDEDFRKYIFQKLLSAGIQENLTLNNQSVKY